jgi:hypothetical protein
MSRLNVDKILSYDGYVHISMDDNDIEIGRGVDQKIICEGSLVPGDSDSGDLTRPNTTIVDTSITNISTTIGFHITSLNTVYLVPTDIERRINLPSTAAIPTNSWITITDIGSGPTNSGNASKKNITIFPNLNDSIQGGSVGDSFILDIDAQSVTLYFVNSSFDWRIVGF